jgi:hypothetical protein
MAKCLRCTPQFLLDNKFNDIIQNDSFNQSDVEGERAKLKVIFTQLTSEFETLKKQRQESRAAERHVLESPVLALPSQESSEVQFIEQASHIVSFDEDF